MASALTALANATATFTVAGVGTVTDPDTGNVRALEETVTVSCFLKADRQRAVAYPGVEVLQSTFDGYALTALDSRIVIGTKGVLLFGEEEVVDCEVVGLRYPFGSTGLVGQTLGAVLGERIQLISRG